jgi:hypothetical protein
MHGKAGLYIKRQPKDLREIIELVRNLILTNFPEIKETVMKEGLWYQGKFYLTAFKDHVNLGVGVNGLNSEELKNFEGKGRSMRHLKLYSVNDIDEQKLLSLMRLIHNKTRSDGDINWKS